MNITDVLRLYNQGQRDFRSIELERTGQFGLYPVSGKTLSDADFSHAAMAEALLRGAILSGSRFRGSHLQFADLCDADLKGADLSYADLKHANLSGADLEGADLTGADLERAVLKGARVTIDQLRPTLSLFGTERMPFDFRDDPRLLWLLALGASAGVVAVAARAVFGVFGGQGWTEVFFMVSVAAVLVGWLLAALFAEICMLPLARPRLAGTRRRAAAMASGLVGGFASGCTAVGLLVPVATPAIFVFLNMIPVPAEPWLSLIFLFAVPLLALVLVATVWGGRKVFLLPDPQVVPQPGALRRSFRGAVIGTLQGFRRAALRSMVLSALAGIVLGLLAESWTVLTLAALAVFGLSAALRAIPRGIDRALQTATAGPHTPEAPVPDEAI